jgi:hypothetical protein
MTTMTTNIFERLAKGRPATEKTQEPSPAQKLLDWLQRWKKPTVCTSDILQYGPYALRNRETAINSAEILVRNGWLSPAPKGRFDARVWQVIRKPIIPTASNCFSLISIAAEVAAGAAGYPFHLKKPCRRKNRAGGWPVKPVFAGDAGDGGDPQSALRARKKSFRSAKKYFLGPLGRA